MKTTIENVIEYRNGIANALGVSVEHIKQRSRKREVVELRQILSLYIHEEFKDCVSLTQIAELVGLTNHATIIYSCKVINERLEIGDDRTMELWNKARAFDWKWQSVKRGEFEPSFINCYLTEKRTA